MRSPATVLKNLQEKSCIKEYQYKRLYRNLYNPAFFLLAYQNIYASPGNMTPGTDGLTLDGVGIERIQKIIESLKDFSYKPMPARRQYIPKKNGGKRPLGIPSVNDKLVQEVVRLILESIYEPNFLPTSHGFRPGKSCHTALADIKVQFTGTKWFIEGDIKGCFDNIDHHILVNILRRRIKDENFIDLIWKFLKAGYIDCWQYHNTFSGTPQGSIISPILANIYLNEFDVFVDEYKKSFDIGEKRADNKEFTRKSQLALYYKKQYAKQWDSLSQEERRNAAQDIKKRRKEFQSLPSKDPVDPKYRRMFYQRYADDFIIAVMGSKADAERIKSDIGEFLANKLKLTLSPEKTLVTNGHDRAKFLGYEITISDMSTTRRTPQGMCRTKSAKVRLLVPHDKWVGKLKGYEALKIKKQIDGTERWVPLQRNNLIHKEPIEILSRYNAEIRGMYNYYSMANNVSVLNKFFYIMEYSMYKTLCAKYKTKISKIKQRFCKNGEFGVEYDTKSGRKRAVLYNEGFRYKPFPSKREQIDNFPKFENYSRPNTLVKRLIDGRCELCGAQTKDVCVHQVKKLKELSGTKRWEQIMMAKKRKTLVLCADCHQKLHDGLYD